MSDSCLFCAIVSGSVPASVLEETASTLAFVDLRQPIWPDGAHVLVVPKDHVQTIDRLPEALAGKLMTAVVRVARAVQGSFEPPGLSVWSSNGAAADQEIPHVHLHVLTRQHGDDLLRIYPGRPTYPELDERQALAARLGDRIRNSPAYE